MAADYWQSTQHLHWETPKASLDDLTTPENEEDKALIALYPLPESRFLNIYLQQQLAKIGRRLSARQAVVATAMIFIRRLYTRLEIRRTNPYLILATAFYLACKIEECPQHIKIVVNEARNLWPDFIPSDTALLGECEFLLISTLSAQLIIHHPYRPLITLCKELDLTHDELTLSWAVVNDSFVTDLPMCYSPHVVAVAAVCVAVVVRPSLGGGGRGGNGNANVNANANAVSANSRHEHAGMGVAGPALHVTQTGDLTPFLAQPSIHASQRLPTNSLPTNPLSSNPTTSTAHKSKSQRLSDFLVDSSIDVEAVGHCVQEIISLYVVWEQYNDKECRERIGKLVHEVAGRKVVAGEAVVRALWGRWRAGGEVLM